MGDEKDSWKVKTLDEILQEKKRRKEQEEKAEIKRMKNVSCPLGFIFNGIICFVNRKLCFNGVHCLYPDFLLISLIFLML